MVLADKYRLLTVSIDSYWSVGSPSPDGHLFFFYYETMAFVVVSAFHTHEFISGWEGLRMIEIIRALSVVLDLIRMGRICRIRDS